jgi:CRISPR/Cas system CSM-associated protein Csm3 (group 7 of RAMP superfamily)
MTTSETTPTSADFRRPGAEHTLLFEGHLTTIGGFRVTFPESKDRDKNLLPRLSGRLYIPSSGIRGALRHHTSLWFLEEMRKLGRPVHLDDWFLNTVGGVRGGAKDKETTNRDQAEHIVAQRYKRQNPIIALFGSGEVFSMGNLSVAHGLDNSPDGIKPDLIDIVRRENVFGPTAHGAEMLSDDAFKDWIARRNASVDEGRAIKQAKRDYAEQKNAGVKNPEYNVGKRENNDNRHILTGLEIVPPGSRFTHQLRLDNASLTDIGALLQGLAHFSEFPYLGALSAKGIGQTSLTYTVKRRIGRGFNATWEVLDELTIDHNGITKPSSPFLTDALTAIEKALPDLSHHAIKVAASNDEHGSGEATTTKPRRGRPPAAATARATAAE